MYIWRIGAVRKNIKEVDLMKYCKRCGINKAISLKGYCAGCSSEIVLQNIEELRKRKGVNYDKWVAGLKRTTKKV